MQYLGGAATITVNPADSSYSISTVSRNGSFSDIKYDTNNGSVINANIRTVNSSDGTYTVINAASGTTSRTTYNSNTDQITSTTTTHSDGSGSTTVYDRINNTSTQTNFSPNGPSISTTYDSNMHAISSTVTQIDGSRVTENYDTGGTIISSSTTDSHGATTTVTTEANGSVTTQYPDGSAMTRVTDPNGSHTDYTANKDGSTITTTTDANGNVTSALTNHADGSISNVTNNPDGSGSVARYNAADGSSSLQQFNSDGSIAKETSIYADGSGVSTGYFPDGTVNSVSITNADGSNSSISYFPDGSLDSQSVTNADGSGTSESHFPDGSLASQKTLNSDGSGSSVKYNQDGTLSEQKITHADGSGTSITNYAMYLYFTDAWGDHTYYTGGAPKSVSTTNSDGSSDSKYYYPDGTLAGETIVNADRSGSVMGSYFIQMHREVYPGGAVSPIGSQESWDGYLDDDPVDPIVYTTTNCDAGYFDNSVQHNHDGSTTLYMFYPDGQKSSQTTTYPNGAVQTDTFYVNGAKSGSTLTGTPGGSTTTYTYQVDGTYAGTTNLTDGSHIGYTGGYTGNGLDTTTTTNYDANGVKLSGDWSKASGFDIGGIGMSGADTFNADGSSSGMSYFANSSTGYTDDGHGNVTTTNYDVGGIKLNDSWVKADGSSGTDTFKADGSSSGTAYLAGGGSYSYTDDGRGDIANQYHFNLGDNIEIPGAANATNSLAFGPGISLANLTVSAALGSDGLPALLIQAGSGGALTVDGGLDGAINRFTFIDGTSLTLNQLMAQASTVPVTVTGSDGELVFSANGYDTLTGGAGNDTLYAWNGHNTLISGTGVTTLIGESGNDTFVVNNSADIVQAQSTGNTVQSSVSYSLEDKAKNVQNLTLTGAADLAATGNNLDNIITANSGNDTLSGGAGNDTLIAGSGNVTLTGGAGSDTLIGGAGLDTFSMGFGMGSDTVIDTSVQGGIVQLDPGLSLSDLTATQQGNDLLLQILGSTAESVLIKDYYSNPQTAWTIKDGVGNTATSQELLDATAASPLSVAMAQLESDFMAQAKTGITQELQGQGYTVQPDGSLLSETNYYIYGFNALTGYQGVLDVQHNVSYLDGTSASYSSQENWVPSNPNAYAIRDSSVVIQESQTASNSPVINATPTLSNDTQDTRWAPVNWAPGGNSAATSTTQTMPVTDSQGHVIGYDRQVVTPTISMWQMSGSVEGSIPSAILNSPGNLVTTGSYPQAAPVDFAHHNVTDVIQQIYVGDGDHTVNGGQWTVVNAGSGNNVINDAGFVYTGTGNDTVIGAGTVYCGTGNNQIVNAGTAYGGTGNDTMIGGSTMVAGSGNDRMFAGSGNATFQIDPASAGTDIIGGAGGDTSQLLDAFYQSMGINDWQQSMGISDWKVRYRSAGSAMYYLQYPEVPSGYFDAQGVMDCFKDWTNPPTLQQLLDNGAATFAYTIEPLPVLAQFNGNTLQPSAYYATSNIPVVNFSANDYQALAPFYDQGILPSHNVVFGPGVLPADLQLSWGQAVGSISGLATDPQLNYTTLNLSWGTNNQSIQVMIPHADDPLGSGVSGFTFADNTTLSMAQMIAMAPPAPNFDPGVFVFQPGMGVQVVGADYTSIRFGAGITADMITLGLGSLMLRVGANGDVIHIPGFDPSNALGPHTIQTFSFADGTSLTYNQLLTRGFDIYGTTGDETLSGTNLDNRIYAGSGNDTLIGTGANDTLVAGAGVATMIGGTGNETFVINSAADIITADANAASNSVISSVSYVLPDNVQNITLSGSDNLSATGNDLNNVITGNTGNDTLIGGGGNDTYVLNQNGGRETIIDNPQAGGNVIRFGDGITAGNTRFFQQSADLLISYGTQGSSVLIKDFAPNGVTGNQVIANFLFADGSHGAYTIDGQGNASMNAYDANGNLVGDFWQHSDGSYGNDIFNADGSNSRLSYNPDGSYSNCTDDGHGGVTTSTYDPSGNKLSDNWTKADGSHGSDTFNADGSSGGTSYDGSGNYSNYTNDGHGNITTTNYSSTGVKLGDNWTTADGSFGSDTFNATGSFLGSGEAHHPDGSYDIIYYYNFGGIYNDTIHCDANGSRVGETVFTDDSQGNTTTTNFDANHTTLSDSWTHADGTSGSDTYHADGSYSTTANDGHGGATTTNYDASNNMLNDSWTKADGSYGNDIFNADGSYASTVNDGHGGASTTNYDANAIKLSDSWTKADGTYGNDIFNADGSYGSTVNDGHGGATTTNYDANDIKLDDSWSKADGSYGNDTFNADGSSIGASHNPDGSYSNFTNDGNGVVTTVNFDASGFELGYNTAISDGIGNSTVTYFDANGIKLSDSWTKGDGTSGDDIFNADGSSGGSVHNSDGSYSIFSHDVNSVFTTVYFDANGIKLNSSWTSEGGSYGSSTYSPDGSYSSTFGDNFGNSGTQNYDANGNLLNDTWQNSDGSGSDSYTYDAAGNMLSDTWQVSDGSHGSDTYNPDGSSSGTGYNPDSSYYTYTADGQGVYNELSYVADGRLTGDRWEHADGSYGNDTFNADGSSTGTLHNPDGSYSDYTNDGQGHVITTNYDTNGNPTNHSPLVGNALADQGGTQNQVFNFTIPSATFSDPDLGDTLTLSATLVNGDPLPSWLVFNTVTQTFSGTPGNADVSNLSVAVTATDTGGLTATSTFHLDVAGLNATTTANNDNVAVDAAISQTILPIALLLANDAAANVGDTLSIDGFDAVTAQGNDVTRDENNNLVFDIGNRYQSLGAGQTATDSFSYTIADSAGATSTATVNITITGVNDAPVAAVPLVNQTATQDSTFNYQLSPNAFTDIDAGDTLTYSATLSDGAALPSWLTFDAATRTFSGTPGNADVGNLNLLVTATDSGGLSASSSFVLNVADAVNVNNPPVANADTGAAMEDGGAVTLSAATLLSNDTDPDSIHGDTLSITSVTQAASGAVVSLVNGDVQYDVGSLYQTLGQGQTVQDTFSYTIADVSGATSTASVTMSIAGVNDAPVVAIPLVNQAATQDSTFNYQLSPNAFTDIDAGDILTYSATMAGGAVLPSWLSFDAATRTFSGTPGNADAGDLNLSVTATDAEGLSASSLFALNVANVNDAPIVAEALASLSTLEDQQFSFAVPATAFSDADFIHGDTLTYAATLADGNQLPSWLAFDVATGTFSGTPSNGDVGNLNLQVTATDSGGLSASNDFALNVINFNDAPVANADTGAATEDGGEVTLSAATLLSNDTDPDSIHGDTLSITSVTQAASGAVVSIVNGDVQYDVGNLYQSLGADQTAQDTFSYTVADASGATSTASVIVTIAGVNDAPVEANSLQNQTATQDAAFAWSVPADAFSDVDAGDSLTYAATLADGSALPAWLAFDTATRTFSGTPGNEDVGNLNVRVIATDVAGASVSSMFVLDVQNVNDTPVAVADAVVTNEEAATQIATADLLANDHDIDRGDTLALAGFDAVSANGNAITLNAAGNLVFDTGTRYQSLAADQTATDSFTYTISDAAGATSTATVNITINGLNDVPTTQGDSANMTEDATQTASGNVLSNDSDVDQGTVLAVADAGTLQGNYGSLMLNADGSYSYALDNALVQSLGAGQTSTETFAYQATDGVAVTPATLTFTIAGANDAPVVANALADHAVQQGAQLSFTVPANTFTDIDQGDMLAYSAIMVDGSALPGWLTFDAATRTFSGSPGNWDAGSLSVSVTATDTGGLAVSSVFNLEVINVNDAPTLANALTDQSTLEGQQFTFAVPANTFDDVDFIYGDTLTYNATMNDGSALPGWLTFDTATKTFSGTPVKGDAGNLDLLVTATDSGGLSASGDFALNVINANDPPQANADIGAATEDGGAVILSAATLLANDTDPDAIHGDTLNIVSVSQAASGAVVSLVNGDVRYDVGNLYQSLGAGQTATDTFSYTIADSAGATSSSQVTMTITGANDAPVVAIPLTAQNAVQGNAFTYTFPTDAFNDVDTGDILIYSATRADGAALPGWLSFNVATHTFSGTPSPTDQTSLNIMVKATDSGGLSASGNFTLAINASVINGTSGNDNLTGTIYDDTMYGLAGNDALSGLAGNDLLDGGTGADSMTGGQGNDTYVVDNTGDVVTETSTLATEIDTVQSSIAYTLGANVENLTLTGTIAINGTGNTQNNALTGNSADNTLNGGTGADTMKGGVGNDTYVVDNASDAVTENATEGTDSVQSSITYTLGINVENLTLTGTAAINGTGNTLDNILDGSLDTAANILTGGTGNDTYIIGAGDTVTEAASAGTDTVKSSVTYTLGANVENLTLTGTAAVNGTGNTLDNILDGSLNTAANILTGGTGNDTYIVGAGDTVVEAASAGTDTVKSSITYTLGANVENLTLTGTAAINGTGNTLNNVLTGNGGVNTLTGDAGNDTLNGGAGADTMVGGAGNDTYVVDNSGDVVTETSILATEIDTVQSSITYTLVANVENLTLTGAAAINGSGCERRSKTA